MPVATGNHGSRVQVRGAVLHLGLHLPVRGFALALETLASILDGLHGTFDGGIGLQNEGRKKI